MCCCKLTINKTTMLNPVQNWNYYLLKSACQVPYAQTHGNTKHTAGLFPLIPDEERLNNMLPLITTKPLNHLLNIIVPSIFSEQQKDYIFFVSRSVFQREERGEWWTGCLHTGMAWQHHLERSQPPLSLWFYPGIKEREREKVRERERERERDRGMEEKWKGVREREGWRERGMEGEREIIVLRTPGLLCLHNLGAIRVATQYSTHSQALDQ